jgi:hypothetical protein
MSAYEGLMITRAAFSRPLLRAAAALALLGLGVGLSGCADIGDSFASAAFADPSKYELWECKQLETERKTLATRTAELQGLMTKAQTGVAGPVVAELSYRNDYIAVRGQAKLVEETWSRNKCRESTPGTAAPAATPAPPVDEKPAHQHTRSGNAIY